jgi:hypothetical protein
MSSAKPVTKTHGDGTVADTRGDIVIDPILDPSCNFSSLITKTAEVARRKADERESCAVVLAEIARSNPAELPAVATIIAEMDVLTPGLMAAVTTAVPGWNDGPQTNGPKPSRVVEDLETDITFADSPEERVRNEETLAIMTAPAEPDFDFIENYVKFADRFETPKMIHVLLAISLIGAIANGAGITFEYSGRRTPLDLWIIAVMASGTGKNEALNLLTDLLAKAGMLDLVTRSSWGSPEACSEQLAARPTNFFVFTEAAILLAKLNSPRWSAIKPLITDSFDSNNIPPTIKHRTNGKGTTNTPDVEFTQPVRNSFLLMSNRDWLQQQLREYDATGGWLARFLWIAIADANRSIHKVPLGDAALETRLKNKLLRISKIEGEADTSAIYIDDTECVYAKWYDQTRLRWKRQGPLGEIFWARWRATVLKFTTPLTANREIWVAVRWSLGGGVASTRSHGDCARRTDFLRTAQATP